MKASYFLGTVSPTNKVHRWQSGSNIDQQNIADKEADVKMTQWASRTNVFLDPKKKIDSGLYLSKNANLKIYKITSRLFCKYKFRFKYKHKITHLLIINNNI